MRRPNHRRPLTALRLSDTWMRLSAFMVLSQQWAHCYARQNDRPHLFYNVLSRFSHGYQITQGGPKNWHHFCTPWLCQILTDFQYYFTVRIRIRRKFAIGLLLSLKISPHLMCVATLPCEMSSVCRSVSLITPLVSGASPAWVGRPATRWTHNIWCKNYRMWQLL